MEKHDIMTLEEIAKYLRVSERTVYDWAQKGEIPCGKFGTSWRFRRADIERWIDKNMRQERIRNSEHEFNLGNVLKADRIILSRCSSKTEILNELLALIGRTASLKDIEELKQGIFYREKLMSTGIGMGVAVPHVRIDSIKELIIAVAVNSADLPDYESIDSKPVRIVFMIVANSSQHAEHLKALAAISSRIKDPRVREAVLTAESPDAVCGLLLN